MNEKREVMITTKFFPNKAEVPYTCGCVTFWRYKNGGPENFKMYHRPTQTSLNRLAKILYIDTAVTRKPDNIEVTGAYYSHATHTTTVIVTGRLN